jgi:hypothetical protein
VRRVLPAVVLAVSAVALTLVLVLRGGGEEEQPQVVETPEVAVDLNLSPRIPGFGDTLTATVAMTVDRRRVDPDSLRVQQEFSPWGLIAPPGQKREDSEHTTLVTRTYVMRCVIGPCVPPRETAQLEFDPVVVSYRLLEGNMRHTIELRWPVLAVHSQIVQGDLERREAVTTPWRADLVSLPEASYGVSPTLARVLLFGGACLLALAGIALAYRAVPKREPEPEPEPEPLPVLPPLELALILLTEAQENGEADRRRALELVAEEMEARDEFRLARRARALAWSEVTPTLAETSELAGDVRAQLALLEPDEPEPEEEGDDAPVS